MKIYVSYIVFLAVFAALFLVVDYLIFGARGLSLIYRGG